MLLVFSLIVSMCSFRVENVITVLRFDCDETGFLMVQPTNAYQIFGNNLIAEDGRYAVLPSRAVKKIETIIKKLKSKSKLVDNLPSASVFDSSVLHRLSDGLHCLVIILKIPSPQGDNLYYIRKLPKRGPFYELMKLFKRVSFNKASTDCKFKKFDDAQIGELHYYGMGIISI